MTDIGMVTRTAEFRSMGEENADIVQHGSFPDKIKIRVKVGHFFGGTYGFIRHLLSMRSGIQDYLGSFAFWLAALACLVLFFYPDPFYALAMSASGGD